MALQDKHKCVKDRLKQDCPICLNDLDTSRDPPMFLKCDHNMHFKCYKGYIKTNVACPLCKKSIVDMAVYEVYFD